MKLPPDPPSLIIGDFDDWSDFESACDDFGAHIVSIYLRHPPMDLFPSAAAAWIAGAFLYDADGRAHPTSEIGMKMNAVVWGVAQAVVQRLRARFGWSDTLVEELEESLYSRCNTLPCEGASYGWGCTKMISTGSGKNLCQDCDDRLQRQVDEEIAEENTNAVE